MARRAASLSSLVFAVLLGACDLPHHDVAMQGTADWVLINYAGEIAETLPLARRHCAQYERVPVLRQAKDNKAVYGCVRPGTTS